MDNERFERGLRIRKELMGAEHVERSLTEASDFDRPLQELVTEYAWGAVWGRDLVERRLRSVLNLGMLVALNRQTELKGHIKAALNNGLTETDIRELLLQTAVYCGAPAALEAFRTANAALTEVKAAGEVS